MKIALKRLTCFLMSSLMCISANVIFAKADTQLVSKTATLTFSESQQQSQSQVVNLPNLASVDSVTVDSGNVSFTQNGTNLTIKVSSGSVKRTNTPSKVATSTSDQYLNSTFPATKSYNDGTYSGSLSQSGSPYVIGGNYTPLDTRTATATQTSSTNSFPATVSYNDGVYSGTLSKDGSSFVSSGSYTAPWDEQVLIGQPAGDFQWWATDYGESALYAASPPTAHDYMGGAAGSNPWDWPSEYTVIQYYWSTGVSYSPLHGCDIRGVHIQYNHYQSVHHNAIDTRVYSQNYSGQVTKPAVDTRTWRQDYRGTVYASTQNYYSYIVTINYTTSYEKPVLNVAADNQNNHINLSWTMSDATQTYNYSVYRKASADTSFQKVADSLTGLVWSDSGGKDKVVPNQPSIVSITHNDDISQFTVNYLAATDNGSNYQYYLEATGQTDGTKIQSPTISSTIMTGIKGYSIAIDDSPNTVSNGAVNIAATSYTFLKPDSLGFYIHVTAVDNAGNVSAVTHYHVDDVISVTHPVCISYAIDPNSATPFTAPDISIVNNSNIPVKVSVQSLAAITGGSLTMYDVSPTKYTDWSKLTAAQTESDLALGVGIRETATGAGTWSSISAVSTIYSNSITAKTLLGVLNPNGAKGNLSLNAKCGLAWDKAYTVEHSMSLIFELT